MTTEPARIPDRTLPPSHQREAADEARKRRILVVDDNETAAETLACLLDMMGNETCQANDGRAAVESANRFRPDVVLLDISLPDIDGYEAALQIRRSLPNHPLYLIALSGWDPDAEDPRYQAAGFGAYLTKPVALATLRQILDDPQTRPV